MKSLTRDNGSGAAIFRTELGYSQMHISRMLRRALRQMHEQLMS